MATPSASSPSASSSASSPSSTPLTPLQIYRLYRDRQQESIVAGEDYYLVNAQWLEALKVYAKGQGQPDAPSSPGPIDNSPLLCDTAPPSPAHLGSWVRIKPELQEKEDFVLVDHVTWQALHAAFQGGPVISRRAIVETSFSGSTARIELVPFELQLVLLGSNGKPTSSTLHVYCSKKLAVKELLEIAFSSTAFSLSATDRANARLWSAESLTEGSAFELLENLAQTLDDCKLAPNQQILIELKHDGKWPFQEAQAKIAKAQQHDERKKGKSPGFFTMIWNALTFTSDSITGVATSGTSIGRGVCGLHNLGNTCFLNSALQCLSNTQPLTEYFLDNRFRADINKSNPLGMGGQLAEYYAALLKVMWSGTCGATAPKNVKWLVGKKNPRFSGYQQQDAQELMAFLLDGLHEDLNLVQQKPYVETRDSDGRPDAEVAAESWQNHLRRNQSMIVDLCQGQLKTTLVCPDCAKVSITFDPIMYLSLPLPSTTMRIVEIIVWKLDNITWPVKYAFSIASTDYISDLVVKVAKIAGLDYERLVLAHITTGFISVTHPASKPAMSIPPKSVTFAYQLAKKDVNVYRAQLLHRQLISGKSGYSTFGLPFIIFYPRQLNDERTITGRQFYYLVWKRLQRVIAADKRDPRFAHLFEDQPADVVSAPLEDREKEELSTTDISDFDPTTLPFKIHHVTLAGQNCARCSYKLKCAGCLVNCDDEPLNLVQSGCTLAITWNDAAVPEYYHQNAGKVIAHESCKQQQQQSDMIRGGLNIYDAFRKYTCTERLGLNDQWYCPSCKSHKQADMKYEIWRLPEILIIHLKRFRYDQRYRDKINMFVDFPITSLDMSPFVLDPGSASDSIYELYAVCNHLGGMGGGHYTAYAKNCYDEQWYHFNDSYCSRVQASEVQSSAAYVLFYRRSSKARTSSSSSSSISSTSSSSISSTSTSTSTSSLGTNK